MAAYPLNPTVRQRIGWDGATELTPSADYDPYGSPLSSSRSYLQDLLNPIPPALRLKNVEDSRHGDLPGRAYVFVIVDEVGPNAKLVRKVFAIPEKDIQSMIVNQPEVFGFHPRDPKAPVSIGEHALGDTLSKYISASTLPGGAPDSFGNQVYYIDIAKLEKAGIKIHSTQEIVADLDRLGQLNPALALRIAKLKSVIEKVEGEVLIEGSVPSTAVQTAEQAARELKVLGGMSRGVRVLGYVGMAFSVYDMSQAAIESEHKHSVRPLAGETIRQIGGWGGAWAGMKIGFAAGAAVGIETGPGALVTGLAGSIIFGFGGYWLGNKAAKLVE